LTERKRVAREREKRGETREVRRNNKSEVKMRA
jgi:hypothetical protein